MAEQLTPERFAQLNRRSEALYALQTRLASLGFSGRLYRHADRFMGTLAVLPEPGRPERAKVSPLLVSMLPIEDDSWEFVVLLQPQTKVGSAEQTEQAAQAIALIMNNRISQIPEPSTPRSPRSIVLERVGRARFVRRRLVPGSA